MTRKKIKIIDDDKIRDEIDALYERQDQITLARWALKIADHIIQITNLAANQYQEIAEGFKINELWQHNKARMCEVRQVGFKIHRIAKEQNDELEKTIFRVI